MAAHGRRARHTGRPVARRAGPAKPAPRRQATPPSRPALPAGPFRLGAVAGSSPGKWIDTWSERFPRNPLEFVPLDAGAEADALRTGAVDAAIARLPLDGDDLHVIPLYREVPVVVCAADSHLTAADELTAADLAGEVLIVPEDDVLDVRVTGTVAPVFDAPETTADAIATVATGVGIAVVPMSLARLHHRKDTAYRPLVGGPVSAVGIAWPVEDASPLVDAFVGVVRGRSANSSRA